MLNFLFDRMCKVEKYYLWEDILVSLFNAKTHLKLQQMRPIIWLRLDNILLMCLFSVKE